MKTHSIAAPAGFHWMQYDGGPVLMVGDYVPHDGAAESIDFEVIDEHDPSRLPEQVEQGAKWDAIYNAVLEQTGNKELAAATATTRAGSRFKKQDDPATPAKPSERRRGSEDNPEGSASGQRGGIELSEANVKALENLRDEHNDKVGDSKSKRANLGALKAVFRRGAGAFSTSHRPSVSSRDQWALGRVKAFLKLLSSGRPSNPKYTTDYDLLPEGHPKAVDKKSYEKRLLFIVSQPTELDVVRKSHLCGVDGQVFKEHYLEPLGLTRDDVDVIDIGELEDHKDSKPAAVIALGKAARIALGELSDFNLPHPWSIRKSGDKRGELARKFKRVGEILEKQNSYAPPLGVQDAAARGLMLRGKFKRGGTEVGVARARDLKNGRRVSIDTIKRMVNFFTRHAKDLEAPANKNPRDPGYPGAGLVAFLLWGGSPGKRWAEKILRQYEREQSKKSVRVYKADDAKRIVYGVVLDPYSSSSGSNGHLVDAHSDYVSPLEVETTAHNYLANSRAVGLEHNGELEAQVVESWIHPYPSSEDYRAAMEGKPHKVRRTEFGADIVHSGSWILGVKLKPDQWDKVKAGELNAFSIGGYGTREPIDAGELPAVEFING
jgi:hypothetical protein